MPLDATLFRHAAQSTVESVASTIEMRRFREVSRPATLDLLFSRQQHLAPLGERAEDTATALVSDVKVTALQGYPRLKVVGNN